jgi:small subunit ribosomal protein S19e
LTTVFDVPADVLINRLSSYFKNNLEEINPPDWAEFVKTGVHVERAPQNPDWWYVRAASMMRKLYLGGPIGVSKFRKLYGGRKRRGAKPAHFRKGSGNIIRKILQQLETANLAAKKGIEGRIVSPKGRSLLDAMSSQIKSELERNNPDLKKY